MAAGNPFRRLILSLFLFLALVVVVDVVILVAHPFALQALPVTLIGATVALACLVMIVALAVTGRRYNQRTRQILAGDYVVRWQYAQGEWRQFVMQERVRSIHAALIFLPLTLVFVVLIAWLCRVLNVPLPSASILLLLLLAAAFVGGLVYALAGRSTFERRAQLAGDTYISLLGILRPDGYRPLQGMLYHLAAVDVLPGRPSLLRFRLQLGWVGNLLSMVGNTPPQIEARLPVPYGHEAEAAQIGARLLRSESRVVRRT